MSGMSVMTTWSQHWPKQSSWQSSEILGSLHRICCFTPSTICSLTALTDLVAILIILVAILIILKLFYSTACYIWYQWCWAMQWSSKVVPYSITSAEHVAVSWQSATGDNSHKPGGRLPLLSTRPAVTFLAEEHPHWPVPNYTAWWHKCKYAMSQKTVQNCFCQNFVKFPPVLIILGRKMAKRLELCEMHSFSTSPNSLHHTTVLNANVPYC